PLKSHYERNPISHQMLIHQVKNHHRYQQIWFFYTLEHQYPFWISFHYQVPETIHFYSLNKQFYSMKDVGLYEQLHQFVRHLHSRHDGHHQSLDPYLKDRHDQTQCGRVMSVPEIGRASCREWETTGVGERE